MGQLESPHQFPLSPLAIRAASDPKTLQARLGHASAAFTLQQYGHAIEDAQRGVADRLDELIEGQ